jgi:SAM-dependent methyltransferase
MKNDEKEAIKQYGKSFKAYHNWRTKESPQGWFYNDYLEIPAVNDLLGDIRGKKVLDFGCGTGIYAKALVKKGAEVKGFDISEDMFSIARKENPSLDLRQGSGYKIPFKEKFDIVLASLVVHYFDDWNKMFQEVARVLKKGGYFIFSTGNPVMESVKKEKQDVNYFHDKNICVSWKDNEGKEMKMCYYHKTYEKIIRTIIENSFEITDYRDCFPIGKAKRIFPKEYEEFSKKPLFTAWKVKKKSNIF